MQKNNILTPTSHPMYNRVTNCSYNTKNDIIPNYKNNLDNIEDIFIKTKCNKKLSYDRDFYIKKQSTDLPIANMPSKFLINNSTKLSENY